MAPGVTRSRNVRSRCRCSMCPAIHINSRSWLRSSSTHEPSDPPHRVVSLPFGPLSGTSSKTNFTFYTRRAKEKSGFEERAICSSTVCPRRPPRPNRAKDFCRRSGPHLPDRSGGPLRPPRCPSRTGDFRPTIGSSPSTGRLGGPLRPPRCPSRTADFRPTIGSSPSRQVGRSLASATVPEPHRGL